MLGDDVDGAGVPGRYLLAIRRARRCRSPGRNAQVGRDRGMHPVALNGIGDAGHGEQSDALAPLSRGRRPGP